MLAIDTYFVDLDGEGPVSLFDITGGWEVQQEYVTHPLSIGNIIKLANKPGQNDRPPEVADTTFNLAPGDDQQVVTFPLPGLLGNTLDPDGGTVQLTAVEPTSTLGAALAATPDGSFSYDPRGSAIIKALKPGGIAIDTVAFTVTDSSNISAAATANIIVHGSNDPPTLAINAGGQVGEGGVVSITRALLLAEDPDDFGAELVYTVTGAPTNGHIELLSNPGTSVVSFTQADIDADLLIYRHNGGETVGDTFGFSLSDGGESGVTPVSGVFSLTILAVNDPPTNGGSLPGDVTVVEDIASNIDLSAIALADPDGDSLSLSLSSSLGGVLAATSNGGVTVFGAGTAMLTLSGAPADLNAYLAVATSLTYTGPPDVSGDDSDEIAVSLSDGGMPVALGSISIDITAVNDNPSNAGSLPANVVALEDIASNVDLSALTLADPDGDSLSLSLSTSSGGILTASSSGGVAVSGSGTAALILSGSATDLNAYLDVATNVSYAGPTDVFGDDVDAITASLSDGGTPLALGAISVDISGADDPPSNGGSLPTVFTVLEDTASSLDLSALTLVDPDGDSLSLSLSSSSGGVLAATASGGVTVSGSGTATLTLSGAASDLNAYLDVTSNVTYTGPSDVFGEDVDAIAASLSDGGTAVALGSIGIDISGVDDPPTNTGSLPTAIAALEDTASNLNLSALALLDPDGDSLTLTLTASSGGVIAASSGGGVTASGAGAATLTLSGSAADLNAYLDVATNVSYTGPTDVFGDSADVITVAVSDGGAAVSLGSVAIDIAGVNDSPSNSGSLPTTITAQEDVASNLDLNAVALADPDGDGLNLSLSASNGGILAAISGGGVTVTGSGTATLTLSGVAADLNAFIDVAINITYTGPNDVFGDDVDTIAVSLADGGTSIALGSISVDIAGIDDPPSNGGSLPAVLTTLEDAASDLDLGALTLVDPDGDSLTLALSAASGGILSAASSGGVTVSGTGTAMLTLSGAASDLNAFLDVAANLSYTGPTDIFGNGVDSISASLSDGGSPVALGTVAVNITAVDDPPSNTGTLTTNVAVLEDTVSDLDLAALTLFDPDGDNLTFTLTAAGGGVLSATSGGGVISSGSGTAVLSLSGSVANLNAYLDVTANLTYTGPANAFGDDADTIAVSLSDGGTVVSLGSFNIDITGADDPPSNSGSLPTDLAVLEDIASDVDLSSLTLVDPDGDDLSLTLTVASGLLAATSSGGVVASGAGTATLTLSGSATDLNAYLDVTTNVAYTGPANTFGDDVDAITVAVSDGGAPVALGTVNVDITGVDDPPSNSGSLPTDLAVLEDIASDVDLSSLTLVDPDGDDLSLTLTASSGLLAAASSGGVTVSGTGTATLTLSGSATDLNAYLDVTTNVTYTGPTDAFGDDVGTVAASLSDGGTMVPLGTINIDITAVNDAPVIDVNLGATAAEGGFVLIATANLDGTDADDDGAGLTFTVTAGPTNGQLELITAVGVSITSFTQADLDANLLIYRHDGSETTSDSFAFSLSDGGESGVLPVSGTFNLTILAVNDDPSNAGSLPTDVSLVEDVLGALDLSGITLADPDAGANDLTVTLTASAGSLTAAASVDVDITGSGTDTVTLVGTLSQLNAYLAVSTNIAALGALNLAGDDALSVTVTVNDGSANGSGGGVDVLLGSINLDLTAVNDDPYNAGALPTTLSIILSELTDIDLGSIDLVDVDAGDSELTLTLSAGVGVFTAISGAGITVGGSATGTLTLTGTVGDLNNFLDDPTNIVFLGVGIPVVSLITVTVNDNGATGSGGGGDVVLGSVGIDLGLSLMGAVSGDDLVGATPAALSGPDLGEVVDEALLQMAAYGLPEDDLSRLRETEFLLDDLPDSQLGRALPIQNRVIIDYNGAGLGYSLDAENDEMAFEDWMSAELEPNDDGQYDLVTVVMHELGHLLGYEHSPLGGF